MPPESECFLGAFFCYEPQWSRSMSQRAQFGDLGTINKYLVIGVKLILQS